VHVRFDERDVETGHGLDNEAPANERAGYRQAKPKPPRHISTLQALIFSALKVGGYFSGEIPHPVGDFKGKYCSRVCVLRLWRLFSGLQRYYAPSGANCGVSRLRC